MAYGNSDKIGNVIVDYTYYGGVDLYSEGAAEDRLLDYVKNHTASDYERYILETRSWSVMYHLSYIRENVAAWLPIKPTDRVLEIGSGCGAITGVLARMAGNVTCVELSKKRSLINAFKNKEYDNVRIMVGNFEDVEKSFTGGFDCITLIGVLEYAGSYINDEKPYTKLLGILKKHLNPGGKIVIAIENRLGMKYLAGCKEDHLGKYFAGIEGYGPESKVRTFSKEMLENLITGAGFTDLRFYYPYPDYKLPHTVYSDDMLPGTGELNTNLRNYDDDRLVLFDESKAFDSMIEEGMFPEFANSFVVIASPDKGWQEGLVLPVFAKYANERMDRYRVCTLINREPSGARRVFKKALSTHANIHMEHMSGSYDVLARQYSGTKFVPAKNVLKKGEERGMLYAGVVSKAKDSVEFEFVSGITLEDYLNELEAKEQYPKMESLILEYAQMLGSCTDIVEFRRSVRFDEVFGKRDFKKKYVALNPCNYDMIFSNIVLDGQEKENGKWTVIDYEWVFGFAVPVRFIVYRALYYHFRDRNDDGFSMYLSRKGMDVYSLCGIDIGERMLFNEMEHAFQVYIIGGAASLEVMQVLMPTATIRIDNVVKMGSYLRNLDTPKIYFSRGTNYTSENQLGVIGKVEDGIVTLNIPFERYINSLRIDPTEYPCLLHLESLRYALGDGVRMDVSEVMVNGYLLSDNTFVYDTNDAQLIIEGIPQNAKSLEVRYRVTMMEEAFYEDLVGLLRRQKEQEEELRKEFSYRLKRKVGMIKEDVLPEGFVKVRLNASGQPV